MEGIIMAGSKKPKLGSGKRFAAIEESAKAGGARNPAGVAYKAGVKAHGKSKMTELAVKGRKSAAKKKK